MLRIVYFGMTGQFSAPPLEALLQAGVPVEAVIVPRLGNRAENFPRRLTPAAVLAGDLILSIPYLERTIVELAFSQQTPVWEINSATAPETLALLDTLAPDLIIVSCFPYLFPPALLAMPRHGCLNLHPSLLPAYRGPEPLFWIAYHDERLTGVTLHWLDQGMDSGDVVAQTRIERPDGLTYQELERRCARAGAELMIHAFQKLAAGESLPRQPQDQAKASYFPQPTLNDFVISPEWPARRAFNFLRGAAQWPLRIQIGQECFIVRRARSYAVEHALEQPYILLDDELWVQCQPGVLRAKIFR